MDSFVSVQRVCSVDSNPGNVPSLCVSLCLGTWKNLQMFSNFVSDLCGGSQTLHNILVLDLLDNIWLAVSVEDLPKVCLLEIPALLFISFTISETGEFR